MANLIRIADAADPRLVDYTGLTDLALRTAREPVEGLFIAEGEKVIRRALDAGYTPRSLLLAPKWLTGLADAVAPTDVPVFVADEAVLERVTGFHVHRGALASMKRRPLPTVDALLATARRVVVLEDVNEHTNVGAVFRSVAALGVQAVLLSPRCADPLYRRAVKVSMGAVFAVPYARMASWYDGLADLRATGFRVLALTPDPQATPLSRVDPAAMSRWALLLGGEGHGLSRRWLHESDQLVRIPMAPGVDSLNVAAAAAVACYALTASGR